jgi:hypothetical protein
MTNDANRIAALEAEVSRLQNELTRYRPPPVIARPDGPFVLPDSEMVQRLVERVFGHHKELRAAYYGELHRRDVEPEEYFKMVRGGMLFASTLHRTRGEVNRKKAPLDWLYDAADGLTLMGRSGTTIRGSAFYCGCICAGDIPYTHPRTYPIWEVGLAVGPGSGRYAASNAWLRIGAGQFDSGLIIERPTPLHAPAQPHEIMMGHRDWRVESRRE